MNVFFSVVVTVYNKEEFISETLQSVLNQTFTDFEVVVVNDGSSDGSLAVIEEFKDNRIRVLNQVNQGASAARNNGMLVAQGEFIALLDGDDLWESNYLEQIHNAVNIHPEKQVFASAISHKYNGRIEDVSYSFERTKDILVLDYFAASKKHPILTSSSIVFRKKEILEKVGKFDESIKSGEDTDYWISLGLHYPIVFLTRPLVYYIYSSTSLSNAYYSLAMKPRFDKYLEEEKKNEDLRHYVNQNRYSMALMAKIYNEHKMYNFYKSYLTTSDLSLKKRFLLNSPRWILNLFLKLKSFSGKKLYYRPTKDKNSS